jgi:hypothetical protein
MNNTTRVLPFDFERYFYGQTNTSDSNYNATSIPQTPYWGKTLNTSKKNTSVPSFEPSNETKKWGMMLAFFGKNKTLKTPSLPKASAAVVKPAVSKKDEDLLSLPLLGGDFISTPVVTKPKNPAKPKLPKNDVTLPIFGGGDLSTPKPTGPFLSPSLNDLFQTLAFSGKVANNQNSSYWGDPHVADADRPNQDLKTAVNFNVYGDGIFNLLKDKNIALSAEHKKYDNWKIEVTNQVNLALGNSNVVFNAYGVPTLNGKALEQGKLMTLPDGSSVNWTGTKLIVRNANYGEYNLDIQQVTAGKKNPDGTNIKYLNTYVNTTDKGVFSDGILPTGILGEGFDMDNLVRTKLNFGLETYKV